MSPPPPYAVRLLALSHARAWATAAWTGAATALGAGFALDPSEWALLAALVVLCGGAVRMTSAHLVGTWLAARPRGPLDAPPTATEYDAAITSAIRAIARDATPSPSRT